MMATQQTKLMTTGRIARQTGIPHRDVEQIIDRLAIVPRLTLDETRLFDDAAVERIVREAAGSSFRSRIVHK